MRQPVWEPGAGPPRSGTRGSRRRTDSRRPLRPLVAVRRDASGVREQAGQVHQVPGHERGVAVGEVVVRPSGPRVEVGRTGPCLADTPGVRLGRDRVADVLQRVEHVLAAGKAQARGCAVWMP